MSAFQSYRARTKFHLGSLDYDVEVGDIIQYNGGVAIVKGKEHSIPSIAAAIQHGWLVLEGSANEHEPHRPQPAKLEMRPAQSTTKDRGALVESRTVSDEERDLGNISKVRDRGDGKVKRAVLAEDASSEGVAVGRIKRPAVTAVVLTPENVTRLGQEVARMDNTRGSSASSHAEPIRSTGAVVVAGDSSPGTLTAMLNGLQDGGDVVVGNVKSSVEATRQARLAQSGAAPKPIPEPELESEPEMEVELAPEPVADGDAAEAQDEARDVVSLATTVGLIRAVIPTFEWDLTRHWKTRVADAVARYGKNKLYMNGIFSVETDAVKTHIQKALTPR